MLACLRACLLVAFCSFFQWYKGGFVQFFSRRLGRSLVLVRFLCQRWYADLSLYSSVSTVLEHSFCFLLFVSLLVSTTTGEIASFGSLHIYRNYNS